MRLWVDSKLPSITVVVQIVDKNSGLIVENGRVTFDGGLVEPRGGQPAVSPPTKYVSIDSSFGHRKNSPFIVVGCCRDPTTGEDNLGFEIHLLPRREDRAVRDHQVFHNLWVRHNDEELVSEPDGI